MNSKAIEHHPPGALRPDVRPDVIMMICTAGHVDHGKTELVKLLTGCDTDRLQTEKERGLSIELGFAPCIIGGDLCVGIVDVPGHERFVRNMVAGVSGIGMAVLVVAADDGVMPQTIEHLQIMELLGLREGIVALTKTDLVSDQHVAQRSQEVREFLDGTFLHDAPICPMSSVTLAGYGEFYEVLCARLLAVRARRDTGIFRMPIERAFSRPGFGTVVTGIPVAGTIRTGEEVELVPGNARGHIRRMECFLRETSLGGAGQCLALNLPDLGKVHPVRGQVLSLPGYLKPVHYVHVRLKAVPHCERPLRNAEDVLFHSGTVEEAGRLYLLEDKALEGGSNGPATVALARPVAVAVNDPFILRRPSPDGTVAGGRILAAGTSERRPRRHAALETIDRREAFFRNANPDVPAGAALTAEYVLLFERPTGGTAQEIARAAMLPVDSATDALRALAAIGKAEVLGDDYFVHPGNLKEFVRRGEELVREWETSQDRLTMPVATLRDRLDWPPPLWRGVRRALEAARVIVIREDTVLPGQGVQQLEPADRELAQRLLDLYRNTRFATPRPDQLPEMAAAPRNRTDRMLEYLCHEGALIRVSKNVVLSADAFRDAQARVVEEIKKNGILDSGEFKAMIHSSRKYALAILDFLDARHVTVRSGNYRKLAPGYEKHLPAPPGSGPVRD